MEWDRAKIKECLDLLAKLPDFENLIFPDSWAAEYNIPITPAKVIDLKEYIRKNKESRDQSAVTAFEVREVAPGGVREITATQEPLTLTIETVPCNDESLTEVKDIPKAENEKELQENLPSGPTGAAPVFDDAGCNGLSAPCP
jgi:hypothetical protein